jgi:hypothetical protein
MRRRGGAASFELVHASMGVEMTENAGKKEDVENRWRQSLREGPRGDVKNDSEIATRTRKATSVKTTQQ